MSKQKETTELLETLHVFSHSIIDFPKIMDFSEFFFRVCIVKSPRVFISLYYKDQKYWYIVRSWEIHIVGLN